MFPFWEILETKEEKDKVITLYQCFKEPLYASAFHMLKDMQKAEDLVHETFITLFDHLDCIDEETYHFLNRYLTASKKRRNLTLKEYAHQTNNYFYVKALSFCTTILKNKIIDIYRKETQQKITYIEEYFDSVIGTYKTNPDRILMSDEFYHRSTVLITNLKYPYKEALILRYYNELSIEKIGLILNKNPDNVRQIIRRARAVVKKQLKKEGFYD